MGTMELILTLLILLTLVFFAWSVYRIFRFVRIGKTSYDPVTPPAWQIKSVFTYFFGQKRVVRETSGWGHFFIFWGFLVLGLATIEMFIRGYNPMFHWGQIFGHTIDAVFATLFFGPPKSEIHCAYPHLD